MKTLIITPKIVECLWESRNLVGRIVFFPILILLAPFVAGIELIIVALEALFDLTGKQP